MSLGSPLPDDARSGSRRESRLRHASSTSTSPRRAECGYRPCGFIQDLCRNSKGQYADQLIILRPWQHEIIHGIFERDGSPKTRIAYVGLPRKNGKSTLCAALAIYGLVATGERGANVYACAGDRQQASIVFDEAKRMVLAEPELSDIIRVRRYYLEGPDNSTFRVLAADAKLQQGLNPSFVIFDEVHVQPNRDLWDAMLLGMGARANPVLIGITTAGFDKTTLAWDLYERGRRGEFYFWWSEPERSDCDWRDRAVWSQANPALGDFLNIVAVADDAETTPESSFRRFHLNQWTSTHTAWLPHGTWAACERDDPPIERTEPITLFLDGSWANDSTGIVACTITDPRLEVIGLWEPDPDLGHIDMAAVETRLREVLDTYDVREIAFDPRGFQDFFARFEAEGYPIVEWPTNSLDRMVPACQEFYRSVLAQQIHHNGDARLASHIANAVMKEDRFGPRIVKESKGSSRKIDLAVCAVGAYDRALWHANKPKLEPLFAWR